MNEQEPRRKTTLPENAGEKYEIREFAPVKRKTPRKRKPSLEEIVREQEEEIAKRKKEIEKAKLLAENPANPIVPHGLENK